MKKVAVILGNYKDYCNRFLADCITGLRDQDYKGEIKIFIYDNETSKESFDYLTKNAPEAELVLNKINDGYAKGNNDCIRLAIRQEFDYVFCLNMDVLIEKDCVSKMVESFEQDDVGAVQARLMLYPEKDKMNSMGNITHFLGFGYSVGYGEKFDYKKSNFGSEPGTTRNEIAYPSGAAVMFDVQILKEVGLFDEEFWMYNEDQDIGWRIWLSGHRCILAPEAVVYHKYEFSRSVQKYYWMDRNRINVILKNYHFLTLILIFPAFIMMEIGLVLFSIKGGWFKEKIKVWKYFLNPVKWAYLARTRKDSQSLRKVKDSDIVGMFTGSIWYQEIDDWKLRLANPLFSLYWKIVRHIIIW